MAVMALLKGASSTCQCTVFLRILLLHLLALSFLAVAAADGKGVVDVNVNAAAHPGQLPILPPDSVTLPDANVPNDIRQTFVSISLPLSPSQTIHSICSCANLPDSTLHLPSWNA